MTASERSPNTAPSILYLTLTQVLSEPVEQRLLGGIRRFARTHGIPVEICNGLGVRAETILDILARFRPGGCIFECGGFPILPAAFGDVPVVYIEAPDGPGWRTADSVDSDDDAVAELAFRELAKSHPPLFAAVPFIRSAGWSVRRVRAFRAVCSKAGAKCLVFRNCAGEDGAAWSARLGAWAASLPPHAAVFAVNDPTAWDVERALAAAGKTLPRMATLVGVDAVGKRWDFRSDAISSVQLDFELCGYLAAKALAGKMEGGVAGGRAALDHAPRRILFSPLLVERRRSTMGRGRQEGWILKAVDLIREKACDGLSAAELPARFRCSRSLFDLRFKEALGHTAQDEIEHVRLEKAFELLRRGTSIGAIAALCGYRTDIALRWVFRRRTGMSMREWRARNSL